MVFTFSRSFFLSYVFLSLMTLASASKAMSEPSFLEQTPDDVQIIKIVFLNSPRGSEITLQVRKDSGSRHYQRLYKGTPQGNQPQSLSEAWILRPTQEHDGLLFIEPGSLIPFSIRATPTIPKAPCTLTIDLAPCLTGNNPGALPLLKLQ